MQSLAGCLRAILTHTRPSLEPEEGRPLLQPLLLLARHA